MVSGGLDNKVSDREQYTFLPDENQKTPFFVYLVTSVAVIGGFLFGYDLGVVAGAMVVLREQYPDAIDDSWDEAIISITTASAAVFSLIGGPVNDKIGRRWTTILASALFVTGSIILAVSDGSGASKAFTTRDVLIFGRIVAGAAIGLSSTTVPSYVAETTPAHIRGAMVACFQLSVTIGFFVAGIFDAAFAYLPRDTAWRLMFGIAAIPAAVQLVAFWFMPESPRWLAVHDRTDEAYEVLMKICPSERNAKYELETITRVHEVTKCEIEARGGGPVIVLMLKSASMRRALTIGCLMQLFQQLSGINTVMYYSTSIIIMGGIRNPRTAIWLTCLTSGVNFLCTFPAIYMIERFGRRKLLLGSMIGVISCLVLLSVGFFEIRNQAPAITIRPNWTDQIKQYEKRFNISANDFDSNKMNCLKKSLLTCDDCSYLSYCGFCYLQDSDGHVINNTAACLPRTDAKHDGSSLSVTFSAIGVCAPSTNYSVRKIDMDTPMENPEAVFAAGWCPNSVSWLPILGMVLYLCSFSVGLGPVPWTVNSEMYPQWARSTGNAMSTATCWIFNLIIASTFLSLADVLKRQGAYLLYAGITILGWIIFYFLVPETKNKSLEQLKNIFEKPWFGSSKKIAADQAKSTAEPNRWSESSIGTSEIYNMHYSNPKPSYDSLRHVQLDQLELTINPTGTDVDIKARF